MASATPEPTEHSIQKPLKFDYTIEELKDEAEKIWDEREKILRSRLRNQPSECWFENMYVPVIHEDNKLADFTGKVASLRFLSPSEDVRNRIHEIDKHVENTSARVKKLWSKYLPASKHAVLDQDTNAALAKTIDLEAFLYAELERTSDDADLPHEKQEQASTLTFEIYSLKKEFSENLDADNATIEFTEDQLNGVDTSNFKKNKEGNFVLTVKPADTDLVMMFANNPKTRRETWRKTQNICEVNRPLFKTILRRRCALALLYKKNSHAHYEIHEDMAMQTPEHVKLFLDFVDKQARPAAKQEIKKLLDLKRLHLKGDDTDEQMQNFYPWDLRYFEQIMLKNNGSDTKLVSEYFPLERVLLRLLKIFETVFGLSFKDITATASPSPDVQVFSVWNDKEAGAEFLGYLYFDLLTRPGQNDNPRCATFKTGYLYPSEKRSFPVKCIVAGFPRPPLDLSAPTLLRHSQVVDVFHETGHAIHSFVSQTRYAEFSAVYSMHDYVEIPSIVLENWCWLESQLKEISCHYSFINEKYKATYHARSGSTSQPSEEMPSQMAQDLIKTRYVNEAIRILERVGYNRFDQKVHGLKSEEEVEQLDCELEWNKMRSDYCLYDMPDEGPEESEKDQSNLYACMTHLVTYPASYYTYLFSDFATCDLFTEKFAPDPKSRVQGMRYRKLMLEPARKGVPMKVMTDFLERPLSMKSFLNVLGITPGEEDIKKMDDLFTELKDLAEHRYCEVYIPGWRGGVSPHRGD